MPITWKLHKEINMTLSIFSQQNSQNLQQLIRLIQHEKLQDFKDKFNTIPENFPYMEQVLKCSVHLTDLNYTDFIINNWRHWNPVGYHYIQACLYLYTQEKIIHADRLVDNIDFDKMDKNTLNNLILHCFDVEELRPVSKAFSYCDIGEIAIFIVQAIACNKPSVLQFLLETQFREGTDDQLYYLSAALNKIIHSQSNPALFIAFLSYPHVQLIFAQLCWRDSLNEYLDIYKEEILAHATHSPVNLEWLTTSITAAPCASI